MKWPKIADVAATLRRLNQYKGPYIYPGDDYEGIDVRLQVYQDGEWAIRFGDASYDQDHRGYWGASSVPGNNKRFESKAVARDLIEQVKEHYADQ